MRKLNSLLFVLWCVVVLPILTVSCEKTPFSDEGEVTLTFSTDTISFDTVFTAYATPVRYVTVYNRTSKNVVISSITLQQGSASRFRLNVDGDTSMVAHNVEIMAGDSIFIFVQANINPNDNTEPFLIEDGIVFGNGQHLVLNAWGRNAVYHRHPANSWVHVIDCEGWDHTRPHVFLDTAAIDSACTLTLLAGEEIYFANDALLLVWTDGTLRVQGTADQPVTFTSLRKDGWYVSLPGQWSGIWFYAGSKDNVMDHAIVENATYGLRVDTNVNANPTLRLSNSVVRNMSFTGIMGQGAYIEGDNLLVYECGATLLYLRCGGEYYFSRSTFADYWRFGSRDYSYPGVILQNWYMSSDETIIPRDLRAASFTDCIIYGSRVSGEILLDSVTGAEYNYSFIHSLVRGGVWDEDPLFVDPSEDDYHLKEDSPAIGIGYQFEN